MKRADSLLNDRLLLIDSANAEVERFDTEIELKFGDAFSELDSIANYILKD
jgi:hypothetical protein